MQHSRRRLFAAAAGAVAAARLAASKQANAQPGTHISFGPLKQVKAGVLDVGYAEAGPSNGSVVILLHGWPYDIHSYLEVVPLLTQAGHRVIVPYLRGFGTTRFISDSSARNGGAVCCFKKNSRISITTEYCGRASAG